MRRQVSLLLAVAAAVVVLTAALTAESQGVVPGQRLAAGLAWVNLAWQPRVYASQQTASEALPGSAAPATQAHPLIEGARLLLAAFIGMLVTFVQRYTRREQPLTRSMEQAHVLLCVSGALTMIIIGDSLARAFGIAGAASIIRFRTPVDDPRDITALFLLMALGMAIGLGLIPVAAIGTVFLCACLLLLSHTNGEVARSMKVALVADGAQFPVAHVSKVFAEHGIAIEPLELSHGDHASARYRAVFDPDTSLEQVSAHLLNGGTMGLKSVCWEASKKAL
jgi:uncharacterized protein DUF4956